MADNKTIKKKKVIKKIVYQEASSSDSDEADEIEYVKVKKNICSRNSEIHCILLFKNN